MRGHRGGSAAVCPAPWLRWPLASSGRPRNPKALSQAS